MNIQLAVANTPMHPKSRPGVTRTGYGSARQRRRVHVMVADEQGIIRDALCALLGAMPEISLVSGTATGPDVLRNSALLRPDVVTIEFPKPLEAGAALIAAMKRQLPETRVIVLTFHAEPHLIEAAMRAGADAYVLKKDGREDLLQALKSVLAGKSYVSPRLSGRVIRGAWRKPDDGKQRKVAEFDITYRELQVIRLIVHGHRTREIAALLSLSHKTIEKHRASIMRKLGLRNSSAVAAYAIAQGLVDD